MQSNILIRSPKDIQELDASYALASSILHFSDSHPRDLKFYEDVFRINPRYIVLAFKEEELIGVLLASEQKSDTVLIGELAVSENARGLGIGSKLLETIEKNALDMGKTKISLGALDIAGEFYLKHSYIPRLFIQVEGDNKLEKLKERFKDKIAWEKTGDGYSKLIVNTDGVNKELQESIKVEFNAHTQYLFSKDLK